MTSRRATHAGSWYELGLEKLEGQLDTWLSKVDVEQIPAPPSSVIDVDGGHFQAEQTWNLPIDGLKAIIAPHAGYSYSGPAAAWAYRCIDAKDFDRVFILGPSHHVYLDGCALSACDTYDTPLGSLPIDKETNEALKKTGVFAPDMDIETDEDEHSIEMHLPYIRRVFQGRPVKIVPILVGSISAAKEDAFGNVLAPYLADERTLFVVSSDFCHWGTRFRFTYYNEDGSASRPRTLTSTSRITESDTPIHTSIRALDGEAIAHLTYPASLPQPVASKRGPRETTGLSSKRSAKDAQQAFTSYLRSTSNTICGRHPIGVLLGALAELESKGQKSELRFTRYEQSSKCLSPRDSSVSYASAFVTF
jgi:hypothetical protein